MVKALDFDADDPWIKISLKLETEFRKFGKMTQLEERNRDGHQSTTCMPSPRYSGFPTITVPKSSRL